MRVHQRPAADGTRQVDTACCKSRPETPAAGCPKPPQQVRIVVVPLHEIREPAHLARIELGAGSTTSATLPSWRSTARRTTGSSARNPAAANGRRCRVAARSNARHCRIRSPRSPGRHAQLHDPRLRVGARSAGLVETRHGAKRAAPSNPSTIETRSVEVLGETQTTLALMPRSAGPGSRLPRPRDIPEASRRSRTDLDRRRAPRAPTGRVSGRASGIPSPAPAPAGADFGTWGWGRTRHRCAPPTPRPRRGPARVIDQGRVDSI